MQMTTEELDVTMSDETEEAVADEGSESEKKPKNRKKKKSRLFKPFLVIIVIGFCIYAVADIISQQTEIEQLKQETAAISDKITESKQLNDEYTEMLKSDEAEFMERVAVEQLGYAYPNERRFYIISGNDD